MENTAVVDLIFGGVALMIVLGGLFMLFQGVSAMNDKK